MKLILFVLAWFLGTPLTTAPATEELVFSPSNCSVVEINSSGRWVMSSRGNHEGTGEDARRSAVLQAEKHALRYVLHDENVFPQIAELSPAQWDCVYYLLEDESVESVIAVSPEAISFEDESGVTIAEVEVSIDVYLLEALLESECGIQAATPPSIVLVIVPESEIDGPLAHLEGED